jgi:hypothetical protein
MFKILITILLFVTHQIPATTVHVFGDSHSQEFKLVPGCKINWLGAITMHRVGRDGLNFINIRNFGVQEGDTVVYVFGEIDARVWIGKQRDEQFRNVYEVINTLATNYIRTILDNQKLYLHLKSVVYSVTPPSNLGFNPDYPFYGTLQDRVFITKVLNGRLKELCFQSNIYFLDVYDDYATGDGALNFYLSDGSVHLNEKFNIPIVAKLNEILQKN